MRDVQDDMLPDTCTILLGGTAKTSTGFPTATDSTVSTNVPCRKRTLRPGERGLHGAAIVTEPLDILTMPSTVSVTERNLIVFNSETFRVQNDNSDDTWRTATRCELIPKEAKPL